MDGSNGTSLNGASPLGTFVSLTPLVSGPAGTGDEQPSPSDQPSPNNSDTDLEQELLSLEAELRATTAKAAAIRARVAERELEVRAALRSELDASRVVLAELERQHEVTVAMIEEAARVEVDRILAGARRVANGQRSGAFDNDG